MPNPQATPPRFVMWRSIPPGKDSGWQRQWFGNELDPSTTFNVRGLGIREPMFNPDIDRPIGTGDWLIMFFHEAVRLDRDSPQSSADPKTLIFWPPGAPQFYSYATDPGLEPHSWMHVEGTWVTQQVDENRLPTSTPLSIENESLVIGPLQGLMDEMSRHDPPDRIILENLFQIFARSIARQLRKRDEQYQIPAGLLKVRRHLDEHFTETIPLDDLARIACMSRSHLCHQFREYFGMTTTNYVIRKRMSMAQRLLYDINLRPGEIAREVGYPDIYQFSKQFKKTFGVSPTRYRQQHR